MSDKVINDDGATDPREIAQRQNVTKLLLTLEMQADVLGERLVTAHGPMRGVLGMELTIIRLRLGMVREACRKKGWL